MSPLPVISGDICIRALRKIGYLPLRQRGSHTRLVCRGRPSVTVPLHPEIDRGTLRSIIQASGLPS